MMPAALAVIDSFRIITLVNSNRDDLHNDDVKRQFVVDNIYIILSNHDTALVDICVYTTVLFILNTRLSIYTTILLYNNNY